MKVFISKRSQQVVSPNCPSGVMYYRAQEVDELIGNLRHAYKVMRRVNATGLTESRRSELNHSISAAFGKIHSITGAHPTTEED